MRKLILGLCSLPLAVLAQVNTAQPAPAAAQGQPPAAHPADPQAPVPRVSYRSVFADTPTGVERERTDWKRANAEVGQFRRGHVDLLKWEAENAGQPQGKAQPAAQPQAQPAAPAPGPANPQARPQPHQHHHGARP